MALVQRWVQSLLAVLTLSFLLACVATPPAPVPAPAPLPQVSAEPLPPVIAALPAPTAAWPLAAGLVMGRNERLLIYRPQAGDQIAAIAKRFLGDANLAWQITEANGSSPLEPQRPLLVPLQALNPLGVRPEGVQTIPILCYHRFGNSASKMVLSPASFSAQLEWLASNGYHVVRLAHVADFLAGRRPLPAKSVVITIDDGYESTHRHAFPLLRQYGFAATLFVYTDFVGSGDALRWSQLQEMQASGLIDIQAHSKTHRNLIEREPGETEARLRANLVTELQQPRELLQRRVPGAQVRHLAYPFGDANAQVVELASQQGYELGVTVVPGGNAFHSQAMLLRRTMIFGDLDLDGFKAKLQTRRPLVP